MVVRILYVTFVAQAPLIDEVERSAIIRDNIGLTRLIGMAIAEECFPEIPAAGIRERRCVRAMASQAHYLA